MATIKHVYNDKSFVSDSSGNIGIGTVTPLSKLHIKGGNLDLSQTGGDGNKILLTTDTAAHYIQANGYFVDIIGNANEVFRVFGGTNGASEYLRVKGDGVIQFNSYGVGTLVTDANGNISASSGGGAGGPFLPLAGNTTATRMTGSILIGDNLGINWLSASNAFANISLGTDFTIFCGKSNANMKIQNGSFDITLSAARDLFFETGSGRSSTFSSGGGASGDCVVIIEADTDNTVENSNPILKLQQDGGGAFGHFGLNGDANNTFVGAATNGTYARAAVDFQIVAGSNVLCASFVNTGRVGIGTIAPTELFEVQGAAANISISNTAESDSGIIFKDSQAPTDQAAAIKFSSSDQKLKFFVNDAVAQRMVIDTAGNVGIGTGSPDYKLEVAGTMFSQGNFGNKNSGETIGVQFEPGSTSATTMAVYSDELKIYYKGPNTTRFIFDEDGDAFKPGGGSWSSSSDERVKKDITSYTKGLTEILAIDPVNYKYNGKAGLPEEKQQIGVIAQDIQKVFPDAVQTYKALFNNDDTEETELLAFNPSELTFTLINAVKELKAELEDLKSKI